MRILARFHNLKFRNKLLLSYFIIMLIPLVLWAIFSYIQTNKYLKEQQIQSFNTIFDSVVTGIQERVGNIEKAVTSIARNPVIGEIANAEYEKTYDKYYDVVFRFDPLIDTTLLLNGAISEITVYTAGDIKGARSSFKELSELREKPVYKHVNNTIDVVWYIEFGKLYAAQQVFHTGSGNQSSVMLVEINYDYIFNDTFLNYDKYSMTIQNSLTQTMYEKKYDTSSAIKNNLIRETMVITPFRWNIDMEMDLNAVLVSPYSAFVNLSIFLGISFILLIIVILFFSKTFVKRIEYLNNKLSQIVSSGFKINIASDNKDEIGSITNNIGKMVNDTRVLINEVYISKLAEKNAQIKALQSQINPHFLYNTLSAINWEAIKSKNTNISKIATALSIFYRSTLNKGNSMTTVRGEIDNIKAYLDIQLFTHNYGFDVYFNIDEQIYDYNMPNIILQPIIENAIEHGIDLKTGGRGELIVNAYERDCDIVFEIIDNGNGITKETVNEVLTTNKKGYGVKNVNDRLKLFFDRSYGIEYESVDGVQTKTIITIPKYVSL